MTTSRTFHTGARLALVAALGATAIACAAPQSKSPPRGAQSAASAPAEGLGQAGAYAPGTAQADAYAPPPPASPGAPRSAPASSPAPAPATSPAGAGGAASRSIALQSASNEIESSQRELDVAAGDCRNACRALGSMDRAAGKVCELSQAEAPGNRCEDAKQRVYSARDRVKSTCGGCPGGPSVERSAPVPSPR